METLDLSLLLLILGPAAFLAGFLLHKVRSFWLLKQAKIRAGEILQRAREEIDGEQIQGEIERFSESLVRHRELLEKQIASRKKQVNHLETRLESMGERLTGRKKLMDKQQSSVDQMEEQMARLDEQLKDRQRQIVEGLQKKSGEERQAVLQRLKNDLVTNSEMRIMKHCKSHQKFIKNHAGRLARRFHGRIISRCDIPTPADVSSAALKFPDQDAYDRLQDFYEKHGERLIETIDSSIRFEPDKQLAVIENMEPVQKEIAYRTMNNIVQQKKFNFDLVQSGVKKYRSRVRQDQFDAARQALRSCRVSKVPDEIVELLGILQFRTSYGQPQIIHSMEVSRLSSLIAAEIGADADLARRAGLLHDIGKAVDRQRESGHAEISGEIAEEFGESETVINALKSHHGDHEPSAVESIIVATADAISGSRPGARKENVTNYSERIANLRKLASNRPGVRKVYAMSAGRELRIWVDYRKISDADLAGLAREIAHDIEENLTYSGEIKVNAIREMKIIKTAHISR